VRRAALLASVVGAAAVVHAGPIVTNIGVVRRRLWPGLAGLGDDGHVALTFDDGPDAASTPAFLKALDKRGVHATFFMLGDMVERFPNVAADVMSAGHEIAVHGFRHKSHLERSPADVNDDIARAVDVIGTATGVTPTWFRPPYGSISSGSLLAARRLGLRPVLWTTWGRDWRAEATPDSVVADVERGLGPGGTVLLHDSDCTSAPGAWHSALGALDPLFDLFDERGLVPGPLRDHGI